jgi:hypothetical protein
MKQLRCLKYREAPYGNEVWLLYLILLQQTGLYDLFQLELTSESVNLLGIWFDSQDGGSAHWKTYTYTRQQTQTNTDIDLHIRSPPEYFSHWE